MTTASRSAKLGLGYAYGGTKRLVDTVGIAFAKEIFFTAKQFTAREAYEMGLVNRVVEPAALLAERPPLRPRSGPGGPSDDPLGSART